MDSECLLWEIADVNYCCNTFANETSALITRRGPRPLRLGNSYLSMLCVRMHARACACVRVCLCVHV